MDTFVSCAPVRLKTLAVGRQANRAIGTMETLLFLSKLCNASPGNTHGALKLGTREGEAANL